jgi:predicted nucleotidyltransferase
MTTTQQNQCIIDILKPYDPQRIGIFGSWARGENRPGSDLDILVRFGKTPDLFSYVGLALDLEEALGMKIDLATENSIRNERVRKSIDRDLRIIYE